MQKIPCYDNPYWEHHLPINPPGGHYTEGDVMLDSVNIGNWTNDNGEVEFRPRLRDRVEAVERRPRYILVFDDEAPELDWDYGYDCD